MITQTLAIELSSCVINGEAIDNCLQFCYSISQSASPLLTQIEFQLPSCINEAQFFLDLVEVEVDGILAAPGHLLLRAELP